MNPSPCELDVRPILRDGGEPFSVIMESVAALAPGQSLRLLATFKPIPLFQVLGSQGFEHSAREIGNGDWEVLFTPVDDAALPAEPTEVETLDSDEDWPSPSAEIDCRDLVLPEPMVKTLEAVETLAPGETLISLLPREPQFLFPELEARGCTWRGERRLDGSYKIMIRRWEGMNAP